MEAHTDFKLKYCKGCLNIKDTDSFYADKTTVDGFRGKCKECLCHSTKKYRETDKGKSVSIKATKKYQSSDRGKAVLHVYKQSSDRRLSATKYQKTPRGKQKAKANRAKSGWREKSRARSLARKHLVEKPCSLCNKLPAEAHHPDYAKPLDVIWLCFYHHRKLHNEENRAKKFLQKT